MNGIQRAAVASALTLAVPCLGGVANFDDRKEGKYGTTLIDGGITFSDVIVWDGSSARLCVDDASVVLHSDQFSPPNILTFGIFQKGPSGWASTHTREVRMTRGRLDSAASVDVFYWDWFAQAGTVIQLDALLDGKPVATDSFTIAGLWDPPLFSAQTLAVEGVAFDSLRLWVSDGPNGLGFVALDNVSIVPAPGASAALFFGWAMLGRRRRP